MLFCKTLLQLPVIRQQFWKCMSNAVEQEIKVPSYCDLYINLPYHVTIKPLDVFKHPDSNKLRYSLTGASNVSIKHMIVENNIKICSGNKDFDQNGVCNLEIPIRANVHVITKGNINAGSCSGDKMILKSTNGSITVDKYQGKICDLATNTGEILIKGPIVASNIRATISKSGSIRTKRLQGINAALKTKSGNIHVNSSYCDNATFETENGNLELQNLHKRSTVLIKKGNLWLSGLDGELHATVEQGTADIQIARILNDSKIDIRDGAELLLRLSDDCQENVMFEIVAEKYTVDPTIKLIPSKGDDQLFLTPPYSENHKYVKVTCAKGFVHVQSASWADMLKLQVNK